MQLSLHNSPKFSPVFEGIKVVPYYLTRPARVIKKWHPSFLVPDLVAGLTVGLIALPQAIAFALIANLPPEMGLYATVVAAIVGALWGSTDQIQTGPANAISILTFSSLVVVAAPGTPEYILAAGILAVMAGVLQLGIGLTRLGLLVNFVSYSVIVGFASGAAVLIAVNQIKPLLGLQFESSNLLQTLTAIITHLPQTHWPTAVIGFGTLLLLLALRHFAPKLPGPLLSMIAASVVVFGFGLNQQGVDVIGQLPRGLPPLVKLPIFDLELIGNLSTAALAVAAIGLIQTTAIARSIASQTGQRIDNNQEFVGQGMANIAVGFFSGYPGAASFARSAVNLKAGAKSAISGIIAGILVLLAMLILAPAAAYLPKSALAAVLILIAYGLIDRPEIIRIFQGTRSDTVIMVVTFFGTLFLRMEFAVLAGILFSFAFYILKTSLPRVFTVVPDKNFKHFVEQLPGMPSCPQLGILKISGDLYFGAVSHVEEALLEHLANNPQQRFLLLRMHGVNNCDMSGILMLEAIREAYRERGGDLFFMKVQESVDAIMHSTGFYDKLGADHFLEEEKTIGHLFYHVLDPAICIYECEVKVFAECQNLPKRKFKTSPIEPASMLALVEAPQISPRQLWERIHTGQTLPVIVDVREAREFERGHIPTAINRPLSGLLINASPLADLQDAVELVFVCQSGRRSQRAANVIEPVEGRQVQVLRGGMLAWEASNRLEAIGPEQPN
ncbi:MAG: SulP family inorganic anion transporter [Anaerolineae bacterium]